MKKNSFKIFLTACVLCFTISFTVKAADQHAGNKYVTVRVFESPAPAYHRIIIVFEDGTLQEIELVKAFNTADFISNTKRINETLNNVADKGYELVTACGTDSQTTTYTFVKK